MTDNRETEILHAAIRRAVEEKIQNDGRFTAIGPVLRRDDGSLACILEIGDIKQNNADKRIELSVLGQKLAIELVVVESPPYRFLACYGEIVPEPAPNDEPNPDIRGGQSVWNSAAQNDWGSITIAAKKIRIKPPGGTELKRENGGCLSANHVLYSAAGGKISCNGLADCMDYYGGYPTSGGGVLTDAALATIGDLNDLANGKLVGFKRIKQNDISAPTENGWIASVGAHSGVTTGFDRGPFDPEINGIKFYGVRKTTPGFSCCHDSGAPVLNADRKLVGLVFAGQDQRTCEQRPHAIYLPFRKWGDPLIANTWDLEVDVNY